MRLLFGKDLLQVRDRAFGHDTYFTKYKGHIVLKSASRTCKSNLIAKNNMITKLEKNGGVHL